MQTKHSHTDVDKVKKAAGKKPSTKWSAQVNETSDALDLEQHIFSSGNAGKIAASLKESAEKSRRRKGTAFQSAMSMLNFYINRAGKNLSATRRKSLEKAKEVLRNLFHKEKKQANGQKAKR